MPLPSFLGPFTALASPHVLALGTPGGGARRSLAFTIQPQQETEWCWAASTASIDAFYGPAGRSQCQVASGVLGASCCATPSSAACNQPYYLDAALGWAGHLAQPCINGSISLLSLGAAAASVEDEINAGHPIGCHISWSGGGGHFNVIFGYDAGTQDIDVADPFFSVQALPYAVFESKYQGAGSWDASYLTH